MRLRSISLPFALVLTVGLACARTLTASPMTEPAPEPAVHAAEPAQQAASAFDHTHAAWTRILAAHVKGDGFDYAAVKKDPRALEAYLKELRAVRPADLAAWTKDQRFAFWINVYNAHTIQKVVENYPLKSIRKLDGTFGINTVFDKRWIPMESLSPKGNKPLSLNDVEHKILRERFPDARLHAAINCASYSCPPLRNEAFIAERLDKQLEEQMRAFVVDPKRNVFDKEKNRLRLSEIFKWFKSDFNRDAGTVRDYVLKFAPADKADFIREAKISYIDYDWSLNDVPAE